jgi:hypothetical protein
MPRGRPAKYPFADLDVGQCFTIPADEVQLGTARVLAMQWGKRLGRRFSCHTTPEGWRIERVADAKPAFAIAAAPARRTHRDRMEELAAVVADLRSE